MPDATPMDSALRRRRQAQPDLRALLAALIAATFSATASAGVRHIEDEKNTGHVVIQMEVTPADEPSPVFEHRLTYGLHERLPGNRPQWYARAYPEETHAWSTWNKLIGNDDFEPYYTAGIPVNEVAWNKLDEAGRSLSRSLVDDHIVPGAMRRDCDWGIRSEQFRGTEFFEFLLPEMQSSRSLARMLNLQMRLAIHERRYEDAVKYLRTEYQLGADVSQEPLIVCGLVGIAITGIANSGVADLIAAPESPNLYWALSAIPNPPVSLRDAIWNESANFARFFPLLEETDGVERSPEEWNAHWKKHTPALIQEAAFLSGNQKSHDMQLALVNRALPLLTGVVGYTHAKTRLVDWGMTPPEVEAMPVGKVLSLYSNRIMQMRADRYLKAYLAPYSASKPLDKEAQDYHDANVLFSDGPDREVLPFGIGMLFTVRTVRSSEVRAARDLAALRVIEALRMHAARNDSRWPDTLDDVTCVPVPLNPATDKPFLYHRDGKTAVLELPASEGFPGYSRRYEITIAKP
ncbi:hypothetical protein [Botrimarina mediterranea]|uniref:hypothetical protein n=1 Tax=Botrimarina mediterranea TaxID=2528022 RepID=UPI0011A4B8CF|nr:hypothetical protein [Botrimarina mediterranea]